MKILVAVKRVVDYKTSVRVKADGSGVETSHVKMSMNPFDEIAVEEALRIKEKKIADEVIIVSIGSDACQETIRSALSMGADRGILVKTREILQPLPIAKILREMALREQIDLILLGKQAIDSDDNQVGQMLAGLLDWPQGTFASKINFHDEGVSVTREIDGGLETDFLKLPAVITTDLRLNEPRYITLPNIMLSKKKTITILEAETLKLDLTSNIKTLSVSAPDKKRASIYLEDVADLAKRLSESLRVSG